jgi:transposase
VRETTMRAQSEDEIKAYGMFSKGLSVAAAARALNRPDTTVRCWKVKWEKDRADAPEAREEVKAAADEMEIASLEQRLRQLRRDTRLAIEPRYSEAEDWSASWHASEKDNAKRIEAARERHTFDLDIPSDKPVAFSFISDQHITTGNTVDLQRMREDAELIASSEGVYAILGGDACDNHIKHRVAILASRCQPSDQWRLFDFYLSIFASKIAVVISGNHDLWTDQIGGVDVLRRIILDKRLHYAPDEARLNVTVGGQLYKLAVRHQYRFNSTMNQLHTVKQWWRFGEEEFDVGCVCHHHEPAAEDFLAHGQWRWACRPGSYQITSGYSRQFGYNRTFPTCPTVVLWPKTRRIVGFKDLADGLVYLKGARA